MCYARTLDGHEDVGSRRRARLRRSQHGQEPQSYIVPFGGVGGVSSWSARSPSPSPDKQEKGSASLIFD